MWKYFLNIYWCWWFFNQVWYRKIHSFEIQDIKILSSLGINWWFFLFPLNFLAYLEVKSINMLPIYKNAYMIPGVSLLTKSCNWCGFNIWLWIALWRLAQTTSLFIVSPTLSHAFLPCDVMLLSFHSRIFCVH